MIGVDLVYIPEFERQLDLGGQPFLDRAFNTDELTDRDITHLAGLWAAKEAVFKASAQPAGQSSTAVAISVDDSGRPSAVLDGECYEISISHHHDYVIAVALRSNQ